MREKSFLASVVGIAVPVGLQSMLQSSFSMIDQLMVGQLGSTAVSAVEVAGRPASGRRHYLGGGEYGAELWADIRTFRISGAGCHRRGHGQRNRPVGQYAADDGHFLSGPAACGMGLFHPVPGGAGQAGDDHRRIQAKGLDEPAVGAGIV